MINTDLLLVLFPPKPCLFAHERSHAKLGVRTFTYSTSVDECTKKNKFQSCDFQVRSGKEARESFKL